MRKHTNATVPAGLQVWREILWSDSRPTARALCWFVFFLVICPYLLSPERMGDIPPALEFGVVGIAAALGGLVLNAGLSSGVSCKKRREFIAVAQNSSS